MPMPPSSDTDDIFKTAVPLGGLGADSQLEPQGVDSAFFEEPVAGTEQDLSALAWVQEEMRRSLDAANKALRRYVREADSLKGSDVDVVDPSVLRTARQQLHQGVGALELVGLPAAATLLRACELAVQRYIAKPARVDTAGVEAIERASFALLDYIARMLAGKNVSPLSLFPQYKAVQESAGADRVHPADLWVHTWEWKDIKDDPTAEPRQPDAATRNLLEQQLLALMRGANARGSAATMSDICAGLGSGALRKDQALIWKLAAAFFEGLAKGLMATDVFSKRVASRLLAQFRIIERGGREVSERLAQDILFFCSQCEWKGDASAAPRLAAVREAYGLEAETVVDYTAPSLGRFDPVWVAQAKKRVIAAKDTWSAVAAAELHRLPGLAEQFSLVGDSLERLFPGGAELAQELMNAVNQTLASEDAPPPLLAMEVATSILYVEASLDDVDFDNAKQERRIRRLAERIAAVRSGREPEPLESWMEDVYHRVSDRQTMGSVVQELRAALSESEQLIDQYFRDPAEIKALQPVPSQLLAMRGVLAVLGMDHAQHAVSRMSEDIEQMIAHPKPLDDPERIAAFERLADSLGALDFLIDMVAVQPQLAKSVFVFDAETGVLKALSGRAGDGRTLPQAAPRAEAPSAKQKLAEQVQSLTNATPGEDIALADVTRELTSLTQQAVAADQPALAATMSRAKSALENAEDASDIAAARDQLSAAMADFLMTASDPSGLETAPGKLATPPAAPPVAAAPAQETDDEMLEVFIEEAREVIETARDSLKALERAPEDLGEMTTVRRAFHTLKGSSRMVGLKAFGDAGWACEQVFNARLADQQPADHDLLDFSGQAVDYFESWIDGIAAGQQDGGHSAAPIEAAAAALRRTGLHQEAIALPAATGAAGLAPLELPFDIPTADDLDLGLPSSFGKEALGQAAMSPTVPEATGAAFDSPRLDEPEELLPVAATSELASFDDAGIEPPADQLTDEVSAPESPFDFDLDLDLGRAPADPVELEALSGSDPLPDALADEFDRSMAELSSPEETPAPLPALDTMMEADVPVELPDVIEDPLAERHSVLPEEYLLDLPSSEQAQPFETTEVFAAPAAPLPAPDLDIDLDAVQPLAGAETGTFNQEGFEQAEPGMLDLEFPESVLPSDASLADPAERLPTAEAEPVELTPQELAAFEAAALEEPSGESSGFAGSQPMPLDEEEALLEPFSERLEAAEPALSEEPAAEPANVLADALPPEISPEQMPESLFAPAGEAQEPQEAEEAQAPQEALAADQSSDAHAEELAASADAAAPEPPPWPFPEAAHFEAASEPTPDHGAQQSQPIVEELLPSVFASSPLTDIDEAIASQLAELSQQPLGEPEELPAVPPVPAVSETETASAELEPQGGDQTRTVGPLQISIPLFNIYLNEADELSRRLITELSEWSMELHRPVGETSIALAHSLGGSSATVGYTELSQLARLLESALGRSQAMGRGEPAEAALFMDVAEEIRRLLHQFAAGFLKSPQQSILDRLAENEVVSARKLEAMNVAAGLRSGHSDFSPLEPSQLSEFGSLHGSWPGEAAETAELEGTMDDEVPAEQDLAPEASAEPNEPTAEPLVERDEDGTPNIEDVSEPNVLPELHESPELAEVQELDEAVPSPGRPSEDELDELADMHAPVSEPPPEPLLAGATALVIPEHVPVGYVQPDEEGPAVGAPGWQAREPLAMPFPTSMAEEVAEEPTPEPEARSASEEVRSDSETASTPEPQEARGADEPAAESQAPDAGPARDAEHIDLDLGFSAADRIEPEPIYARQESAEETAPAAAEMPAAETPTDESASSNFAPSGFAELAQVELKPLEELPSIEADLGRRLETLHFDEHTPVAPEADDDIDAVDAVDAELFPIFEEEALDLLPRLDTQMRTWARRPNEHQGAVPVMRTLHTFKGGARLAGAMRLGEMAHRMETAVETALRSPGDITADVEALQARADNLSAAFEALRRHEAQTYAEAFAESDHAPLPDLPLEPVVTVEPDVPLSFETEPLQSEPLLEPLAQASPPATDQVAEPVAPLSAQGSAEPEPQDEPGLVTEPVAELLAGQQAEPAPVEEAPAALSEPVADFTPSQFSNIPVLQDVVEPSDLPGNAQLDKAVAPAIEQPALIDWSRFPAPSASDAPAPVKAQAGPAATSSVRVRAPLLERMVNQAGEVSITRARLESEVGLIKSSLSDLTDNLTRLREQLRDVEFQAETQLSSRLEAAKAASQAFDPLEFDRFTRLQELTRMMAESVNDVATVQRTLQRALENTEDQLAAQARLTRDLQDDLLRTRMVEFESLSDRLYRVVRQAAKETGKQVRLDIVGGSIDIDRGVLDRMTGSFEHLVRNAVTHGIEMPAVRSAAGKDPVGTIVISVSHEGNEVGVEFRDDGGGLDLARIREKGVAQGLLDAGVPHSDSELANLIFAPGFSTAATITELAGRGVGMDVVRSEVTALGGRIETATAAGKGASFRLLLPLTTAVTQVVMLRSGDNVVAVPSTLVEIVRRATPAEVENAYRTGHFDTGDKSVPFFWLGALLQQGRGQVDASGRTLPVVLIRSAQQRVALHVDEVLGNQEVVVKNLGPQMSRMPGLVGITLLASGQMTLIYNPVALATLYGESAQAAMQAPAELAAPTLQAPAEQRATAAPLVLVVDDSLTVRRVTQRLLVREGYRVTLAKDGLEALERLADERPAVVLSDIEMPRMDGFDLVRNIRGDSALRDLPVIMITSRIAQKHRDYAAELGVDHYLGKPYSEEDLIALIGSYVAKAELASQY